MLSLNAHVKASQSQILQYLHNTAQVSKQIYYSTLNMSLGKYTGEICLVRLDLSCQTSCIRMLLDVWNFSVS